MLLAGIAIASAAYGAYSSYQAGKASEEAAEKIAEAQEKTATLNYKTYLETSNADYFESLYDMSRSYSDSMYQVRQQMKAASADFKANQGANVYNASSSFYQDVKSEIDNQFDYAVDSMTSAHDTNLYRTHTQFQMGGDQNFQEYLNNLERAEAGLESNIASAKITAQKGISENLFSGATTAAKYYYDNVATGGVTAGSTGGTT